MTTVYELPEWSFVGGETQKRRFELYQSKTDPCDLPQGTCNFSISDYVNASETPYLSKTFPLDFDAAGYVNTAAITMTPTETASLAGRYEYQLTIVDRKGNTSIPKKGLMQIYRNINKQAIPS